MIGLEIVFAIVVFTITTISISALASERIIRLTKILKNFRGEADMPLLIDAVEDVYTELDWKIPSN